LTALKSHSEHGLVMDFAIGSNQGQGVPAEPDNKGLQWNMVSKFQAFSSTSSDCYNRRPIQLWFPGAVGSVGRFPDGVRAILSPLSLRSSSPMRPLLLKQPALPGFLCRLIMTGSSWITKH
jgi:hypothetical protein